MPNLLKPALLFTRLSIFYFLLPWQVMRFTSPDAAKGIAAKYYHVSSLPDSVGLIIGVFWMALLVAFVTGFKKSISYMLVLILHAGAILLSINHYIIFTSGVNQLFLAAVPVVGAMLLLYVLREEDTILSFKGRLG